MRSLTADLLVAQKLPSLYPAWKVDFTHDSTSYTYESDIVRRVKHTEGEDRQIAELLMDNSDLAFNDIQLEGFKAVISYGVLTAQEIFEYSPTAPLWVMTQRRMSLESGDLRCHLGLGGIMYQLSKDKASARYNAEESNTDTVKTIIIAVLGSTLSCFSHCDVYEIVWDSVDSLVDTFMPKDFFRVGFKETRLGALQRLLGWTGLAMRAGHDGKIHFFVPTTTGTTYDAEYEIAHDPRGKHQFFSKEYTTRLIMPSYIHVDSPDTHSPAYTGYATVSQKKDYHDYFQLRLASDAQATAIAEAMLERAKLDEERGAGEARMDVGLEVYDYANLIDAREGDNRVGNVQGLVRQCSSEGTEPDFKMSFRFGKVSAIPTTITALVESAGGGWVSGGGGGTTISNLADVLDIIQQNIEILFNNYESLYAVVEAIVAYLEAEVVDPLPDPDRDLRVVYFQVIDDDADLATGDGQAYFIVPPALKGMNLIDADAAVATASSSGLPTIQIRNQTDSVDMLSTKITIDVNEFKSYDATAPPVIDTTKDDVVTGDTLRIDVDGAGTGTKGLHVFLTFQAPP